MDHDKFKHNFFTLKFEEELENKYREYVFPIVLRSFKVVFYFLLALDVYIIIVDFFRLQDPFYSVATRVMMLGFYLAVILGSNYLGKIGSKYHQAFVFLCMLTMYVMVVFQDANGDMYYLFFSNVAFTLIYIIFTVSGLRFRNAFLLGMVYLAIYWVYCYWLYPNQFHADQTPNLMINWVIAAMAGYILERISRRAFVNEYLLEEQNKKMELVNNKLDAYNSLKDRLLSVVSHDVQTPLNSINSFLQLFRQESLSPKETDELLRKIETQIGGTIGYIQKILFWTKNQMNGFNIDKKEIDLTKFIEQCYVGFSWQAQQKNIELKSYVDEKARLVTDQEMLDIVCRNLISNAIKFSNENKSIEVSFESNGESDTLIIKDQGIGIDPDRLKGIFELSHNHTAGTKLERGSGLGLSLCAEFMKKLNGTLEVESEVGKGSRFFLKFRKPDYSTS